MAATFIESSKIHVFPASNRGTTGTSDTNTIFDFESRLNTEFNLTHLPSITGGKDSYILQEYIANTSGEMTNPWIIVVGGYYFVIKDKIIGDETPTNLFAYIQTKSVSLDATNTTEILSNLQHTSNETLDDTDENDTTFYFRGLAFDTTVPNTATSSLQLYKDGVIFADSKKTIDGSKVDVSLQPLIIKKGTGLTISFDGTNSITLTVGDNITITPTESGYTINTVDTKNTVGFTDFPSSSTNNKYFPVVDGNDADDSKQSYKSSVYIDQDGNVVSANTNSININETEISNATLINKATLNRRISSGTTLPSDTSNYINGDIFILYRTN